MCEKVISFVDELTPSEVDDFYKTLKNDIHSITAFFDIEYFKFYINSDEFKMSNDDFYSITDNDNRYDMIEVALKCCRERMLI